MTPTTAFAVATAGTLVVLIGPLGPPRVRRPQTEARTARALIPSAAQWRRLLADLPPWLPPRMFERWRDQRRDAQLPGFLERLASGLRSGHSLVTAFLAVADEVPPPLGDDLALRAAELRSGAPLGEVMEGWASHSAASDATRLAATALAIGASAGGQVARSVDQVAESLRQNQQVQAEARALASQARASAGLLAVAPIAFMALVSLIEPGVLGFLTTSPSGLACLTIGVALEAVGIRWMGRIVREER